MATIQPPHVENPVDPGDWFTLVVSADAVEWLKRGGKRLVCTMMMNERGYPDMSMTELDVDLQPTIIVDTGAATP